MKQNHMILTAIIVGITAFGLISICAQIPAGPTTETGPTKVSMNLEQKIQLSQLVNAQIGKSGFMGYVPTNESTIQFSIQYAYFASFVDKGTLTFGLREYYNVVRVVGGSKTALESFFKAWGMGIQLGLDQAVIIKNITFIELYFTFFEGFAYGNDRVVTGDLALFVHSGNFKNPWLGSLAYDDYWLTTASVAYVPARLLDMDAFYQNFNVSTIEAI